MGRAQTIKRRKNQPAASHRGGRHEERGDKMAKNNGTLKLIMIILAIGSVFAGLVGGWTTLGNTQQEQAKAVATIKTDGCDVARLHTTTIAEIRVTLKYIADQQEKDTERILRAIQAQP